MHTNKDVLDRVEGLYRGLLAHDGFGEMRLEVRILKKGQKEVLIHCGKQYRFVVDYQPKNPLKWEVRGGLQVAEEVFADTSAVQDVKNSGAENSGAEK